jgi:hypothetical protein
MTPGEERVLTRDGDPVAIGIRPARTSWPCQPGSAGDRSFWMAPDFDAPLADDTLKARPATSVHIPSSRCHGIRAETPVVLLLLFVKEPQP